MNRSTAKTLYLCIEWYLSSSIPSPAACSRRFRRTETTTTTAMKRRELERERAVSVASYMHARCIPSGRHGHMRTAGCHGRPWCWRDMQCHHVNRWGSHPASMEMEGQEAWREKEQLAREGALLLQGCMRTPRWKKETGFCLLLQLSKRPWHCRIGMAAACYREALAQTSGGGDGRTGSSRVTTTPFLSLIHPWVSLSPEREMVEKNLKNLTRKEGGMEWDGWNPNKSNFQTRKRKEKRKQARRS